MWKVVVAICIAVATAHAKPLVLEAHDAGNGVTFATPKGWTFVRGPIAGVAIAQQDPKHVGGAQLLVTVNEYTSSQSEDQVLDDIVKQNAPAKVVKRGLAPNGVGKQVIADATVDGVRFRIGAIVLLTGGGRVVVLLNAKRADFDALGGIDLLYRVVASVKVTTPPAEEETPK